MNYNSLTYFILSKSLQGDNLENSISEQPFCDFPVESIIKFIGDKIKLVVSIFFSYAGIFWQPLAGFYIAA